MGAIRAYVLFVGLDVADLAAVGAFPGRTRDLLGRRLGGALVATAGAAVPHLLLELLLFLALLTSLLVLFQTLLLDAGPVRGSLVSTGPSRTAVGEM